MSISNEEQKKISEKINVYKNKINELLNNIEKSTNIDDKIDLYRKILSLDNTKENYVLHYLLLLKEQKEKTFKDELGKFQVCITDKTYNKYFSEYPRINSKQNILNFINLIKNSPIKKNEDKSIIINIIIMLLYRVNKLKFKNKKINTSIKRSFSPCFFRSSFF